jgi:hypothetical protein
MRVRDPLILFYYRSEGVDSPSSYVYLGPTMPYTSTRSVDTVSFRRSPNLLFRGSVAALS